MRVVQFDRQVFLVGRTGMSLSIWENCSALLYPASKNNNQNVPNVLFHWAHGISKISNQNFCWMESAHKVLSLIPPSPLVNESTFTNPPSCQYVIEIELEKRFHFLTGRFLFTLFGTPILQAIFLLYSSVWLSDAKGAFHLSELTCQTIPIVMRNSLLIKTIQPDQSNLK